MPCGKDGKRDSDTEWRIYSSDGVLSLSSPRTQILRIRSGWRFMVFFITATNPSLALWMTPYRIPSFRAEVRMLYENEEKSQHDTERRIYYPDSVLPSSSLQQQILHIRSGWRFMVFFITTASLRHRSGWYLTVRRQKELLAHAVRLRILACRDDLNRKRTIS